MMECKKALVETQGNLDAAAELMRKQGLAKADKKASRIAAEGLVGIARSADGRSAAMVEVNCETDFVARGDDIGAIVSGVAQAAVTGQPGSVELLAGLRMPGGETIDEHRRALIARIGENMTVRRFSVVSAPTQLGAYVHAGKKAALVALEGGDAALAHDLAMHVTASNPQYLSLGDIPADVTAKEREILGERAKTSGKSPEIIAKMVEGQLRKSLGEITLLGQPFVKDPDQSNEKLQKAGKAAVVRFERYEDGAGIEKKHDDFVGEVMAQDKASSGA